MTEEQLDSLLGPEWVKYKDGTYSNLPYAEKVVFISSYTSGGGIVNGDFNVGTLYIRPSLTDGRSTQFNGVDIYGYTKVDGNLVAKEFYIDAEAYEANINKPVYNKGADAIEVTGRTTVQNLINAGYGYFQDLEVTGRLSNGYDYPFVEWDWSGTTPANVSLANQLPSMAVVAKNLKANTIQNGMNINVSESLTVENDSINNGVIRVDGSSNVKGTFSGSGEYWLTGRGESQTFGDVEGFSKFNAFGVGELKVGSLNSPNGIVNIEWRYKDSFYNQLSEHYQSLIDNKATTLVPDAYNYDYQEILDLPHFEINGDINVATLTAYAIGEINGNITTNGTITREMVYSGTYGRETPGAAYFGGSYDLGGVTVNGDIKTSAVIVAHHQPHNIDFGQWKETPVGALIVNGDVTADWLFVDNGSPNQAAYDNFGEFVKITGTAHITEDVFMGGSMDINKLIVDGTFYNAFGEYEEYPSLPANADEVVTGLNPPDYIASRINELNAKNIVNASNLFVGTLTNDRSQTYTQTYGTIRVTSNWFRDSIINMSGGYINEDSLGPDKNLGINNTFNVTGGTLIVGDLNFDSTVNLSQDGKIQTDIVSIFINPDGDPEALNYVSMNACEPESVKQSLSRWFTNYVAGTLRTDLEDHVNFNGGSIVVSGFGKITQTQYDDLMKAFKEALSNLIGGNF